MWFLGATVLAACGLSEGGEASSSGGAGGQGGSTFDGAAGWISGGASGTGAGGSTGGAAGADAAAGSRRIAEAAKTVQVQLARMAHRRKFDTEAVALRALAEEYDSVFAALDSRFA